MNWEKIRLKDCCISIADGDHQPPPKSEKGIPFVTIANIVNNQFDFTNSMFVPNSYYEKLDGKRKAQKGDILYSVVGSFGVPVLIKEDRPFVFQRHIAILRPSENIDARFLYYTMLSRDFYMKADAAAIGAAQRTVSLTALRNIEITVPSIETQRRIADILSAYDNLIENNQKQIKLLEEAAQRLYKEWFVDLHFPGYEHTKIVDGVPEGWENRCFSDLFDCVRGKSYSSKDIIEDGPILMVNLKNIRAFGGYNRNVEKSYSGDYKESQRLSDGDIIMGVTDMTQERRLVGSVAIVPKLQKPAIFSMDLIKLKPKYFSPLFLYSVLRYGGVSRQIAALANGVNVLHLKPETMMKIHIVTPSKEIVSRYEQIIERLHRKIDLLSEQCDLGAEARDRLLPKLMNGEVKN